MQLKSANGGSNGAEFRNVGEREYTKKDGSKAKSFDARISGFAAGFAGGTNVSVDCNELLALAQAASDAGHDSVRILVTTLSPRAAAAPAPEAGVKG